MRSASDIDGIKDFKVEVEVMGKISLSYLYRRRSVPRELYEEIRNYIDDLIADGKIIKSYSIYASPMVCVQKRTVV